MKKPLGKKTLSYVKDILIESTFSEYNDVLDVYLSKGRYQLCTEGAVYSYEDKYVNFTETFKKINWDLLDIKKVLVLGLGLASIPQMLEQIFGKKFEFHAVEIDGEIIRLAEKYILDELNSPMQIFEMDAEIFIDIASEKYDMIIVDIFEDANVPAKFETNIFIEKAKKLLKSKGILLYNRLNTSDKTLKNTLKFFENIFLKVFDNAAPVYIRDNIVLCSNKGVLLDFDKKKPRSPLR